MIKTEFKFNDAAVAASLEKFGVQIKSEVAFAGVAAMAKTIYDEVKLNVPVKTGTLRDAIYRVHSPEKSTDELKLYRISWNKKKAPHGHLVEFGTSRAPAHSFLRPAFDRVIVAIDVGKNRMAEKIEEIKGAQSS